MFINPKIAVEQGWITGIKHPDQQIQPNAIDFTLDALKELQAETPAMVSEDGKTMRKLRDFYTIRGSWHMYRNTVYDGTSDMYVTLPDGIAAVLYTRSTLARNGVFLLSGLYDSGYKGHIGFTMYPIGGNIEIAQGTRVGQIAFMAADSAKLYAGGWNHDSGTHYTQQP